MRSAASVSASAVSSASLSWPARDGEKLDLGVGDSAARLRSLYPKARLRTGFQLESGYWLVTRQVCAEVGGGAYPGLLARMKRDRVAALVARSSVCD